LPLPTLESEPGSDMHLRLVLSGAIIWLGATILLRIRGEYILHADAPVWTLTLFALTFPAMALLARWLCMKSGLEPQQWIGGAVSLVLPTLLLDPFSSAFFPFVFPNMDPRVAGVFGGWMLWCCAGALAGVLIRPEKRV
jgi:hypothetical protein